MKSPVRYWQLLAYVRPQGRIIVQGLLCTLVFMAIWPLLAGIAGEIAVSIARGDVLTIARLAGISTIVFLIQKIAQYGQDSLIAKASLAIAFNLRKQVYAHLQRLSLSYFEKIQSGDLAYRLTEDIDRVGEVVNKVFHQFVPSILQLIVVLGYMVYLNWQLTLAALIIAPLMALLITFFGEQLRQLSFRSQSRISNLSAMLVEVFSGMRLLQAFAAEEYMLDRFSREAERNRRTRYRTEQLKAIQLPVVGFLESLSLLLLLLLGGWQVSLGNLTGGQFVSYLTAVLMLIDPISLVTSNYNEFKQGEASIDRIFELLDLQPLVEDRPGAFALPPVTGKVEYRNVSFAYQPGQPVLKHLDLLVMPGEAIALVGSSGAGKSTMANLLPRFYDPQEGQILIDGTDIRDVTLSSLRRQIGIVPQETILFSGTIAQNIAFGQESFDLEAVQKAAMIANAHQFIDEFPQGYQTWVGERGVNLSGGQRQRLAIARAVLLNPRILILDEATSALDSESESLVQEALERLMQNRTVFIIAHRLATVRRADRILVLEQGRMVEAGTHAELLEQGGRYARFYAQQFQE
ncbi:ABC transporter ATP-binding protein [Leptothermofonsia sichuanensis E412]|uniref:ABC transporter ATP-binding protein n=1 Tax=Leptothermofonsia sichuanensis TaxID=2917832 RepID=UPI001CA65DA9|nr:ABC transporter ATP-binding protein [Leptothermofonsia sichuanensis]QZZ20863.1 ABC transporter ATP-binding protein [Leptothermofonsia sichuanensis E412]